MSLHFRQSIIRVGFPRVFVANPFDAALMTIADSHFVGFHYFLLGLTTYQWRLLYDCKYTIIPPCTTQTMLCII